MDSSLLVTYTHSPRVKDSEHHAGPRGACPGEQREPAKATGGRFGCAKNVGYLWEDVIGLFE